jgi:hypothetical protein
MNVASGAMDRARGQAVIGRDPLAQQERLLQRVGMHPLLSGLSRHTLLELWSAARAQLRRFQPGEVILSREREGRATSSLGQVYLVLSGTVSVGEEPMGGWALGTRPLQANLAVPLVELAVLPPGAVFTDEHLIRRSPVCPVMTASSASDVLRLQRENLEEILGSLPDGPRRLAMLGVRRFGLDTVTDEGDVDLARALPAIASQALRQATSSQNELITWNVPGRRLRGWLGLAGLSILAAVVVLLPGLPRLTANKKSRPAAAPTAPVAASPAATSDAGHVGAASPRPAPLHLLPVVTPPRLEEPSAEEPEATSAPAPSKTSAKAAPKAAPKAAAPAPARRAAASSPAPAPARAAQAPTSEKELTRLLVLGQRAFTRGQYAVAMQHLNVVVRRRSGDARLHYWLGVAAYRSGRLARAERAFRTVLRLSPGNQEAKNQLELVVAARSAGGLP